MNATYATPEIKTAALTVRNHARQLAAANEANSRRTDRAKFLFADKPGEVYVGPTHASVDLEAANGSCLYLVSLFVEGGSHCTCPDAEQGHLCKHQQYLAAEVISQAAASGVRV